MDGREIEKELAVGSGFMRVSARRPEWLAGDILIHPLERPFESGSSVRSIDIDYPDRLDPVSGTDRWLIYFFIASMAFALIFKPFLRVRI